MFMQSKNATEVGYVHGLDGQPSLVWQQASSSS